jgi:hypothetical protein
MGKLIRPMRFPVRPLSGRWPAWIEKRAQRFFWSDPSIVLHGEVSDEEYRTAMAAFSMGETIKITRRNRHPEADAFLIEHLDLEHATLLDVGASDGSTSADLIEQLPTFKAYVIADLHLYAEVATSRRHTAFFADDGDCFMVVGRRMIAWPGTSRVLGALYALLIRRAERGGRSKVLLVNPRARAIAERDDRVSFAVHDVFSPWRGPTPDVIKVANLLRRDYFNAERLVMAFQALLQSLREGGHLLVANNPRVAGVRWEGALYRKTGDRFTTVDQTESPLDVDDLVLSARDPGAVAAQT